MEIDSRTTVLATLLRRQEMKILFGSERVLRTYSALISCLDGVQNPGCLHRVDRAHRHFLA